MPRIKRDPVAISSSQVEAASALFATLPHWTVTDAALRELDSRFPESSLAAVLLKVTAVNALYYTNIYAVVRMAEHVHAVMSNENRDDLGLALVERLAVLPPRDGDERPRNNLSFASKYAHFFVDAGRFPIFDSYALAMLRIHLGRGGALDAPCDYRTFAADFRELLASAGWTGEPRALDRYLWLAGLRAAWRRGRKDLNREALDLFSDPSPQQVALLAALDGRGA